MGQRLHDTTHAHGQWRQAVVQGHRPSWDAVRRVDRRPFGICDLAAPWGQSVFVPAPEAYWLAAVLCGMSALGLLVLLQQRSASVIAMGAALAGYATVAMCLIALLAP